MSTATAQRAMTSASIVHQGTEDPVTAARLLRMFDAARRDLAEHLMGEAGIGAGYDGLRVDWSAIESLDEGDLVTVTALRRASGRQGHLVEYVATALTSSPGGPGRCVELVQATGWTLPLNRTRENE